jgi:hypothetical protein
MSDIFVDLRQPPDTLQIIAKYLTLHYIPYPTLPHHVVLLKIFTLCISLAGICELRSEL